MIDPASRLAPTRIAQLLMLASTLGLTGVAGAALKDAPPKGITLAGTEWNLDPYRSDDADEVITKAHQQALVAERERRQRSESDGYSRDGGVFGGGGNSGPLGGGGDTSRGTWGGDPTGRDPASRRTSSPFPDNGRTGGGYGHDTGRSSTDIDPTGQSASVQIGSSGEALVRNEFLGPLSTNPGTLSFRESHPQFIVSEGRLDTECAPGPKAPISDSFGDGERRCGWDGRAWVVETTRGKRFSRTDRFEISKDGKTLAYVTTASGAQMPRIRIERLYTRK